MSDSQIQLPDIERAFARLRKRGPSNHFEPAIEAAYEAQTKHRRAKTLFDINVSCLLGYNLLLCVDYQLFPGTFWWSVASHAVVTVAGLTAMFVMRVKPEFHFRESMVVLTPLFIFAQVMLIYVLNKTSWAADDYQYLSILDIIMMNSVQRPDLRFALVTSLVIAGAYGIVIWLVGQSPQPTKVVGSVMMITAVANTLAALRLIDRDSRAGFLRGAQDKLRRDAVEKLASRDGLTGLFNRRYLEERVLELWSMPDDKHAAVAVVMIDVDHFKAFNDWYGHLAGDDCLMRVANAIAAELPCGTDTAVRFGGEEFLVLMVDTDLQQALRIAERIRHAIKSLAILHAASPNGTVVTASLGVMAGPRSACQASDLMAGADTALYAAKHAGRNRVWPPLANPDGAAIPRASRNQLQQVS